ncbi:MAG TPA: type 4a pilus biogenesis protein PilO [Vicinamibacteria bacterium]
MPTALSLVSAVAVALAAAPAAAQATRPFADERTLLDRRLETLRRILPDGPTAAADALLVRDAAEASRLARVEVAPRQPVESGTKGELALDVAALGGYAQIDRFFQRVAVSHRLADVESLTLTATGEDQVQLACVLRFPFWPLRAPLPPPPESRARPSGVPRPAADAFMRDQSLAFAKSDAIAAWRRARRNPRLFLSELSAVVRERPVVVGYAALAEEFTIRGIALGEGPMRAFESRLERGFLRVSDFLIARQGACLRFETHGRSPSAGPEAELPVPVEDPFAQDVQPCRVDRDAARSPVVRGRTPTAKDPGRGPLTLRLRDVDLADVFQVLAALGAAGFVVDGDVAGRASVEVTRATLDEALAALRKAAGVEIAASGAVRRVSTRPQLPTRATPEAGPPASFALKRAEVRDLLAAMAEVDPQLAALGPPGFLGRASVWTKDAPLGALRATLLESAGLAERVEEERRILVGRTATMDAPVPVARGGPEPRLALRREELTLLEFQLAGVAALGDTYVAFAYSPTGQLYAYRAGDRLADALVRAVESTDVLLETDEGPLRVPLPFLPD